jgi:hypothetical protein
MAKEKSPIGPLKPEPLRPFSQIAHWLLLGAVLAASVPALWLLVVLIRGVWRERRQAKTTKPPDRLA